MTEWLDKGFEAEDASSKRTERCAELIRQMVPVIWNKLGQEIESIIKKTDAKSPGRLESGGFRKAHLRWVLRRIPSPPFEVTVSCNKYSIMVEHEFRLRSVTPSEDVLKTLVEFKCNATEDAVQMWLDDELSDVGKVAQWIAEPIIFGTKPA